MTNLILAIIGILMAAAATLVVISYGGDYFVDARMDAESMDLENGLANILAAQRLHRMKTGSEPANIEAMLPGSGSGTLESVPPFSKIGTLSSNFPTMTVDGSQRRAIVVSGISYDLCMSMNMRLDRNDIPTEATGPMGCYGTRAAFTAYKTI